MDLTGLILGGGLLAAWWAGTSAVFEGVKQANAVRDRVVTGKAGGEPLPDDYVRLLLWWEWLPMKLALAAISLMLGVLIVLPGLAGPTAAAWRLGTVCAITSGVPFCGALTFGVSAVVELRFMRRAMRRRGQSRAAGEEGR
jgi:hypothetical protein